MTVKELREALEHYRDDLEVVFQTEGPIQYEVNRVRFDHKTQKVWLMEDTYEYPF